MARFINICARFILGDCYLAGYFYIDLARFMFECHAAVYLKCLYFILIMIVLFFIMLECIQVSHAMLFILILDVC